MNDTEISIQKFVTENRGKLVLNCLDIVRLLGWTNEHDEDYYWVIQKRMITGAPEVILSSCVGGFIPLFNTLSTEDYEYIETISELNFLGKGLSEDLLSQTKIKLK